MRPEEAAAGHVAGHDAILRVLARSSEGDRQPLPRAGPFTPTSSRIESPTAATADAGVEGPLSWADVTPSEREVLLSRYEICEDGWPTIERGVQQWLLSRVPASGPEVSVPTPTPAYLQAGSRASPMPAHRMTTPARQAAVWDAEWSRVMFAVHTVQGCVRRFL